MTLKTLLKCLAATLAAASLNGHAAAPHNIVLFVPDGLRAASVTPQSAPEMAALREQGVNFVNSHAMFPTFTTANASAFATGHMPGDTGDFSNVIAVGFPVKTDGGTLTPFLEKNPVLAEVDGNERYAGNYLNEESVLSAARKAGYATAAIGKVGPVAIQDLTAMAGDSTLIVDDSTGRSGGVALSAEWQDALAAAGLPAKAPEGAMPNAAQQAYFMDVALKVALPRFLASHKPFVMVYWSRDPDGTQHKQTDSPDALYPGINGATSLAALKSADDALGALRRELKRLGLDRTTDIIVAADHGFSTVSKMSGTSISAQQQYSDVPRGELPPGFLAIDLAAALSEEGAPMPLLDPADKNASVDWKAGKHPASGSGLLGADPAAPQVIVAANGGSDLIYLPGPDATQLAPRIVAALLAQGYVSGLFVDDSLGAIPGTLPLSAIGLKGSALTPVPAIVVNFASRVPEGSACVPAVLCAVTVADTKYNQGQGMHGSLSRADTWNFMAATGPDFRARYKDVLPASNADIGMTLAHLMGLKIAAKGSLTGRVLEESLKGGTAAKVTKRTVTSAPAANGLKTVLKQQQVGKTVYSTVAGFPGRTVGLEQ